MNKKTIFKYLLLLFVIILLISFLKISVYDNYIKKNTENLTTTLKDDSDFLYWFIEFDNLYSKKKGIGYPKYSVTSDDFEIVNCVLNNEECEFNYKDGIYYISSDKTLELDIFTRSLRYIKYKDSKIDEVLEVNLSNGIYYVRLIDKDNIYKIALNNHFIKKREFKNKSNNIFEDTIFGKDDFVW